MIRDARRRTTDNAAHVYMPSAAEIRRGMAEVQEHWTARQRARRALGRTRNVEYIAVTAVESNDRWKPGSI